jgi:hypothetical protein
VNDDDGMRIKRGTGQRPKVSTRPTVLSQVQVGQVVLIPVRVCAHFAGAAKGAFTCVLCRPFDPDTGVEHFHSDLVINKSHTVPVYAQDDDK